MASNDGTAAAPVPTSCCEVCSGEGASTHASLGGPPAPCTAFVLRAWNERALRGWLCRFFSGAVDAAVGDLVYTLDGFERLVPPGPARNGTLAA